MSKIETPKSVTETRRDQVFLALTPAELERMRRFGEYRSYDAGQALFKIGERGHGLFVILSGSIDLIRDDEKGGRRPFHSPGPGSMIGELAQLAGRPPLVDGYAREPVCALHHSTGAAARPAGRRGGARRADHARADPAPRRPARDRRRRPDHRRPRRRTATCCGWRASSRATAIRISGWTRTSDAEAKALIERFHVDPGQLPIVLCPGGQLLRNPSELELARCIGLVGPIDPDRLYDVAIVGAGPAGLAAAVYAASEGLSVDGARLPRVRRPGRRLGADRELSRLSDRHHAAWR